MGPAASRRGLFDIDTVLFEVTKSRVKKWEFLARRIYTDYNSNRRSQVIGLLCRAKTSQLFDTRFSNSE